MDEDRLRDRRAHVADVLRENMASGRLPLADYQARLKRLRAATTVAQLDGLLHDLPAAPARDDDRPSPVRTDAAPAGESPPPEPPPVPDRPRSSLVSRFGHACRRLTRRPFT